MEETSKEGGISTRLGLSPTATESEIRHALLEKRRDIAGLGPRATEEEIYTKLQEQTDAWLKAHYGLPPTATNEELITKQYERRASDLGLSPTTTRTEIDAAYFAKLQEKRQAL